MTYTKTPAFQNLGSWIEGRMEFDSDHEIIMRAKVFDKGSRRGIDGGKISKLDIRLGHDILCNYDRGWDVEPTDEIRPIYESILAEFN